MYVNFPDGERARIDTLLIARTESGSYEDVPDDVAEEMGLDPYAKRLENSFAERGRRLWGDREKVTYLPLKERVIGSHSVWIWLDGPEPLKEGHGSHAFLMFTCAPLGDQPVTEVVQGVIDQAELRWADIAFDYWH